ncbi:hypothetical protein AURDEDRAFT_122167 [Auricularia subglabra TFB-10046 SS5]|nr:hypothetical protein AURDEDRAFT_122167 [Auricularia subglabra TFB-10046 SS5]
MSGERDPMLAAVYEAVRGYLQPTSATATSARELEAAFSQVFSAVHSAVADTAKTWNERTDQLWGKLPAELRAMCFAEMGADDKLALIRSSRRWRADALGAPNLWATIRYPSVLCRDLAELRGMLSLSKTYTLSITLDSQHFREDDHGVLEAISEHAHRIRSFVTTKFYTGPRLLPGFQLLFSKPLVRLNNLQLEGWGHLEVAPALRLDDIFPQLRSLHMPQTPLPDTRHSMPTLCELSCSLSSDTCGTTLFKSYPNLERLSIDVFGMTSTSQLPCGPPPATLKHLSLHCKSGASDLTPFFEPWFGHRGLQTVTLTGLDECASVAALFASIYSGPWTMEIPTGKHSPWFEIIFSANDADGPRFEASMFSGPTTILDCVPYLSNLAVLDVTPSVLVLLAEKGNVTLPAVTDITISTLPPSSDDYYDEDDEDGYLPRMFKMVEIPTSIVRVPKLRAMTFNVDEDWETMMPFATHLRSTIEFAAERLERMAFPEVDEEDVMAVDDDGEILRGLHRIADEIQWGEFDEDTSEPDDAD